MDGHHIDLVAVICANVFNLAIIGVMLSRLPGWKKFERGLGLFNIGLIFPLGLVAAYNAINQRSGWLIALPGFMILFLIIELILDYVLKANFRYSRLLGPYLMVFYLAQWAMIGYAFMADRIFGFLTLITYFLSLAATALSYAKVRHG